MTVASGVRRVICNTHVGHLFVPGSSWITGKYLQRIQVYLAEFCEGNIGASRCLAAPAVDLVSTRALVVAAPPAVLCGQSCY